MPAISADALDQFIADLAAIQPDSDDVFNQFQAGNDPNNAIRRANFRRYLNAMAQKQPEVLIVMEAPGYRGSRLTGVPVTSRKVLLEGVPEIAMFGREAGYEDVSDEGFENVYGEQSATIVWGTLAQIGHIPLIWNSFPFHPRKPGEPRTNRKPRKTEMESGIPFIETILILFQPATILAIGNVAQETLLAMGYDCAKIRHPAQGGKNDFVAGMKHYLER